MINTIMGLIGVVCSWVILILTLISIRDFGMHWTALIFTILLTILVTILFVKSERE